MNRAILKRMIAVVVFITLLIKVFISSTYLFRQTETDRVRVVGIKEEVPLDMVYIGGSAAFVYWQPLKAWCDYGFCSYDLGTHGLQAENIKHLVEYALNYQDPKLFVIGIRAFQYYDTVYHTDDVSLRHFSDSLDLSLDRTRMIREYLEVRNIDENIDELSIYLDIMKYHTNYSALASREHWNMINNTCASSDKGYEWRDTSRYMEMPEDFATDVRAELSDENLEVLYDLLNFCQKSKLNVLFVVCPYQITEEEQEKYNTLQDIITAYGFDFLNTNDYYAEMGLDFATDFYDANHVNVYGAEKYTDFLGQYITSHYDLPDHRGEEEYKSWNEDYARFSRSRETIRQSTDIMIKEMKEGKEIGYNIHETNNFREWCLLTEDSRYTIIAVGNEGLSGVDSEADKKALSLIGLDIGEGTDVYIRVVSGANILYTNYLTNETYYEMKIGEEHVTKSYCIIENSNQEVSVMIDGQEYSRQDDGLNVVVFENDYRYVVDSVTLKCDQDGEIILVR